MNAEAILTLISELYATAQSAVVRAEEAEQKLRETVNNGDD